jgi:hypothetical protein
MDLRRPSAQGRVSHNDLRACALGKQSEGTVELRDLIGDADRSNTFAVGGPSSTSNNLSRPPRWTARVGG